MSIFTHTSKSISLQGYRSFREHSKRVVVRDGFEEFLREQGLLDPAELWNRLPAPDMVGRGDMRLIAGEMPVVVRRYRHGGIFRRLTRDLFLTASRPFREVFATEAARAAGIPTVHILAAVIDRSWGPFFRGYLVTQYLNDTSDLIDYLAGERQSKARRAVIREAARIVKALHHRGIYHADLQLKNFLVGPGTPHSLYLIDFDKSTVASFLPPHRRLKNLTRFDRSCEKLKREGLVISDKEKSLFCAEYVSGEPIMRPRLTAYRARYTRHLLWYRWGWWMARLFYPGHRSWKNSKV